MSVLLPPLHHTCPAPTSNHLPAHTLKHTTKPRPQIARGLRYLHLAQPMVIHRDLKLENLLLADARANEQGLYTVKIAGGWGALASPSPPP